MKGLVGHLTYLLFAALEIVSTGTLSAGFWGNFTNNESSLEGRSMRCRMTVEHVSCTHDYIQETWKR